MTLNIQTDLTTIQLIHCSIKTKKGYSLVLLLDFISFLFCCFKSPFQIKRNNKYLSNYN